MTLIARNVHSRPWRLAVLALLAVVAAPALAQPEGGPPVFWVGAAAPCNFNSLAVAIAAVPDGAEIRLANNLAYTDINVSITAKSLIVRGGYADCTGTADPQPTVLTGAAGVLEPVIRVSAGVTPRSVQLRRLQLQGGGNGGLEVSGEVELRLRQSVIDGNQASSGGGVRITGVSTAATRVRIEDSTIGNALPVGGNQATANGGGIACQNARVTLEGAVIAHNEADSVGGGVALNNCRLDNFWLSLKRAGRDGDARAGTPGTDGVILLLPYHLRIDHNSSALQGGGIHATNGSVIDLEQPPLPVVFALRGNTSNDGAGVHLSGSGTQLVGRGLSLFDNIATGTGGAGHIGAGASLQLRRADPVVPDGAGGFNDDTLCQLAVPCNQVVGNATTTLSGGAFFLNGGSLALHQVLLAGNGCGNSGLLLLNGGVTRVDNTLIVGNDCGGDDLVRLLAGAIASFNSVTLAGNATGPVVFRHFATTQGNTLNLFNAIVWQPGTTVVAPTGLDTIQASCLNAHENASVAALTHDPGFVDALGGDFRLHASSSNIDACADPFAGTPTRDLIGVLRAVDLGPAGGGGDFDRGAYELDDRIFANGFEFSSPI